MIEDPLADATAARALAGALDAESAGEPLTSESYLQGAELRRRASGGLFVVGTRGVAVLLLGFGGYVVLARLLTPREFGIYAVGLAFVSFVALLSDGGLGAGLIRRAEAPEDEELRALVGLQLTATAALTVIALCAAPFFGGAGWVVAILVASMLVVPFQFPGRILLERSLDYRPMAIVEVSQVFVYHASAIVLVVLGMGVWGLACAYVLRSLVGTVLMVRASGTGLVLPLLSVRRIRPLLSFGMRFQATTGAHFLGDYGMNWAIATVAGVSTLGLWNLVRRLMEAPLLLIGTFGTVGFSVMSRLVHAKEDSARLLERVLSIAAVGSGVLLAALAGSSAGLIPSVFGDQWSPASSAVPWTCLAFGIGGSASLGMRSYLYAVGDSTAVLRASITQTAVAFAVTIPLLRTVGVAAVGLGWLASTLVEAVMLRQATVRWVQIRPERVLLAPVLVGVAASSAGWMVTRSGGNTFASGVAGGACAATLFVVGLMIVQRAQVLDTVRFAIRSMHAGFGNDRAA